MSSKKPNNEEIAGLLDRIAELLEIQQADNFRIQAYRKGSQSVREAQKPVADIIRNKSETLEEKLDGIGSSLAQVIKEYVNTGRSNLLFRLQGEVSPEDLFQRVPGIGKKMAHRISSELGIETLEELEMAAHDGRLKKVEGIGKNKIAGIQDALAGMLSRSARHRKQKIVTGKDKRKTEEQRPSVDDILDVDAEYRKRAEAGELKKITPRRFNPEQKTWLPILHTERNNWSLTALYSNTKKAHDLGTTKDWVVIYYDRNGEEDQCTVVTQKKGDLKGKRVIRGREKECRDYYET